MRREQGRLREELRLSQNQVHRRAVDLALRAGFHRAAIVDPRVLPPVARRVRHRLEELDTGLLSGIEWPWVTEPSAWSSSSTILICCLSCRRVEPDDLGTPGDPHALIAPFARAHYYRTAIAMLRGVAGRLETETGIPRAQVRLFSNSRIPEKPLLMATGLASYGKNGCALVPGLGSLFVIAGAVIPVRTEWESFPPPEPQADPCGACRRCGTACPVGAIDEPYVVRHDLCLQGMAGSSGGLAEDVMSLWGARLYGCHDCQAACPHNSGLSETALSSTGEIGPSVSLRAFLSEEAAERKKRLRGTALGMSWVAGEALLRNALVAAGNRGDASIRAQVQRHAADGTETVRAAARWALWRL
jgi:epoxyqueuosine reductase